MPSGGGTYRELQLKVAENKCTWAQPYPAEDYGKGGEVTLLSKEAADVGGRPCGDSTTKEVGILSQNRTAEPLPRFGFEVAVEILTNDRFERCHRFQRRESFCSIATALDDQGGQGGCTNLCVSVIL